MPGGGGNPNPPDKPGLELFKGDGAFHRLKERYEHLKEEGGWDFEFVLAKYKEVDEKALAENLQH